MELYEDGALEERGRHLSENAKDCRLCPRQCRVDRSAGQLGYCGAPWRASVASANVHHGEEPPISGSKGSGTVFFAHCTMRCVFCQNYPISQLGHGKVVDNEQLARRFLELQKRGVHNLNLVTPTHYVHAFVSALAIAVERGFRLPVVYNTSGYEALETLRLLDGIVDIYMPDIKYSDPRLAREYSDAPDFIERNLGALAEMYHQVGNLQINEEGLAVSGILVRHLVLPGAEEDSFRCLGLLQKTVAPDCYLSLMSQYFPANKAADMAPLNRRIDPEMYDRLVDWVEESELRGWIQPI
ncbi:MAG: radical SAM protein [Candidatus Sumerlaeota bacterium]